MSITLGQLSHVSYYISQKSDESSEGNSRLITLLNGKGSVQYNETTKAVIRSLYYSKTFIYYLSYLGRVKKADLFNSKKNVSPIEIPSSMLTVLLQIMISYSRFFDGSVLEYLNFYSFQKQYLQSSDGMKQQLYFIDQKDYFKEWVLIDSIFGLINSIQSKVLDESEEKVNVPTGEVMTLIFAEIQRLNSIFMKIDTDVKPLQEVKNKKNTRLTIITAYEAELNNLTLEDFKRMKKIIIQWWFPLPTNTVAKAVSKDFHLDISDDSNQVKHVLQDLITSFAREETLYGIKGVDSKNFAETYSETVNAIHTLGIHFDPEIPTELGTELLNLEEIIILLKSHYSKFYRQ